MAWNGGVSLAVWMGGVAVELDKAQWAGKPEPNEPPRNPKAPPDATAADARTSDALYLALCQAFDRRVVVDILSGASAGGLNGALLAGAMTHGLRLAPDFLRERWLDIGDFARLLQPLEKKDPASMMQGEEFFDQLRKAFRDLLRGEGPPSAAGCEDEVPVLLDVQATDVVGEERCFIDDWDQSFIAREFRSPIKFRDFADYTGPTLAAAARASASFPAAFEPQKLTCEASRLAGFPGKVRWAIDGGLLENAPIKPAIELIPRRRAAGPVKRYVCYVNAAPTAHRDDDDDPSQPTLQKVLSYTINLPRDGRVIDQLTALTEATRHAGTAAGTGVKLLALQQAALTAAAEALRSTYQQRRALLSLEELLAGDYHDGGPGRARAVLEQLAEDSRAARLAETTADAAKRDHVLREAPGERLAHGAARLPWIPNDLSLLDGSDCWRWGVRAAQRVVQLELDALRAVLLVTGLEADADIVIERRAPLDHALIALDDVHADFVDPRGAMARAAQRLDCPSESARETALADLAKLTAGSGRAVTEHLRAATGAFYAAYRQLNAKTLEEAKLPPVHDLFGPAATGHELELPDVAFDYFLQRALAIEVIRRSFADDYDVDAAETLHVAQLTPLIRAPLFDTGPISESESDTDNSAEQDTEELGPGERFPNWGPQSVKDKLAGIRLNHFAGFYRRSWRANDFMWGRLDGAAAIARLLIDRERARVLASLGRETDLLPSVQLARALTPASAEREEDSDRLRLIWELVDPAGRGATDAPPAPEVRTRLQEVLHRDLETEQGGGHLSWAICARALQYEILREELPHLIEQVRLDREAGAFRTELTWSLNGLLDGAINELRHGIPRGPGKENESPEDRRKRLESLPGRLGCDDPDEATSTLGLRTLSQTFLVALAALGGAVPLGRMLQPMRTPLLSIEGATALRPLDRLAVVLGFTGSAWYLASRLLTLPEHTGGDIPLKALWSPQVLAYWVSIFAVLGLIAVPFLRAARTDRWRRRLAQGGLTALAAATAGGIGLGWQWTQHGTVEALTAWNATFLPPTALLWVVAAAGGFQVASSLDSILRIAGPFLRGFRRWVGVTSIVLGGIGTTLAIYSASQGLVPSVDNWGWKTAIALAAFPAPLFVAGYLGAGPLLRRAFTALTEAAKRRSKQAPPEAPPAATPPGS